MDKRANTQLNLINEIYSLISEAELSMWLFGGWAVDFHLGEISRKHSDIEIVIWQSEVEKIKKLLGGYGYEEIATDYPEERIKFEKRSETIDFIFIIRNENGEIVTPGRFIDWPWIENPFGVEKSIGDVVCSVVSKENVLDSKENYEKNTGEEIRDKDIGDIDNLKSS